MSMRGFSRVGAALLVIGCGGGEDGRQDEGSAPMTMTMTAPTTAPGTTAPTGGLDGTDTASSVDGGATAATTGGETTPTDASATAAVTGDDTTGAATRGTSTGATTGECIAEVLAPEVKQVGVDVLLVVDTSNSMQSAIAAVEASINVDFAQILESSGIDYRVIVAGDYPPGDQLDICITTPLSGTDCNPPPPVPAITERYKHYDQATGSGAFLDSIIAWYTTPDPHGLAPNGYRDFLRADTRKVILAMTDATSASGDPALGDAFDNQLLMLDPPLFGAPGDRQYVFHAIVTMDPNDPANTPWLPPDPIQGQGGSIQQVSVLTGWWRFPLSQTADFDVLFQEIAKNVVENVPIACSFPIPVPMEGQIDPNTIEVDYSVNGMPPPKPFHQVTDAIGCELDAFYIEADTVILCPQACAEVQADANAKLDVRYGCDVGFMPG